MTKAERTAWLRAELVRDYLGSGQTLAAYCAQIKLCGGFGPEKLAPSVPTLSRWVRQYRGDKANGLQPKYPSGGGAGATLSKEERHLLQLYYLDQRKPDIAQVCRWITVEYGIQISYPTARRYLNSLPAPLKTLKRDGPTAYKTKHDAAIVRDYSLLDVYQCLCADQHTMDVMCVDEVDGKPFRPYLIAFSDLRSRKIVGWTLLRKEANQWDIMELLSEIVAEHGIPQQVLIDNGKEFTAKSLTGFFSRIPICDFDQETEIEIKGVFGELGCEVIRSTPYHGQSKWIERFFKFLAGDYARQFSTYSGSNTQTTPEEARTFFRAINKQAKKPVMVTLEQLQSALGEWMDDYHSRHIQSGTGAKGMTANEVWAQRVGRTMMPLHLAQRVFCRAELRTVAHKNLIQFAGSKYYEPAICTQYSGRKILLKRPFNDFSVIFLYDPKDGEYLGEAYSEEELGLIDKGDCEANIATVKRLRKQARKSLDQHIEINTELAHLQRRTLEHRHRRPVLAKVSGDSYADEPEPPQKVKEEVPKRPSYNLLDD